LEPVEYDLLSQIERDWALLKTAAEEAGLMGVSLSMTGTSNSRRDAASMTAALALRDLLADKPAGLWDLANHFDAAFVARLGVAVDELRDACRFEAPTAPTGRGEPFTLSDGTVGWIEVAGPVSLPDVTGEPGGEALGNVRAPRARRADVEPRLRVEGQSVYLDNRPVPLDMTAEKKDDVLAFLGRLLSEPGNWMSGHDIGKATQREGVRFDRVRKALPPEIQSLIESDRRKGYRLRLA
jgi:hypothetical protein